MLAAADEGMGVADGGPGPTGIYLLTQCFEAGKAKQVVSAYEAVRWFVDEGGLIDTDAPTVAVSCDNCDVTPRQDPLLFTLSSPEPVVVLADGLRASAGTLGSLIPVKHSDDKLWSFEVAGSGSGPLTVDVESVFDVAGANQGPANAPVQLVLFQDASAPTCSLALAGGLAAGDSTNDGTIGFVATCSEAVVAVAGAIVASSGTVAVTSGGGGTATAFTFDVDNPVEGVLTVTVANAQDASGNSQQDPSNSVSLVIDRSPPVVAGVSLLSSANDGSALPELTFQIAFSEPVFMGLQDVAASSGTTIAVADGSPHSTYHVGVRSPQDGDLTFTVVTAKDVAGNSLATPASTTVHVDFTAPSATLAVDVSSASVVDGATATVPTPFVVSLSERGTITAADLAVSSGVVAGLVGDGSTGSSGSTRWTFAVSGAAEGSLLVSLLSVVDAAGNAGPANAPVSTGVAIDTTGPAATLSSPALGKPAVSDASVAFTATFTEAVALSEDDVVVSSGSVRGLAASPVSSEAGMSGVWVWAVDGAADGELSVTVVAATDRVGNTLQQPVSATVELLRAPPRLLSLTFSDAQPAGTNADPLVVVATFSRAVHLTTDGVRASSGAVVDLRAVDASSYTFAVRGMAQGPLTVEVVAAVDVAGNALDTEQAPVLVTRVDTVAPSAVSFTAHSSVVQPGTVVASYTASEPVVLVPAAVSVARGVCDVTGVAHDADSNTATTSDGEVAAAHWLVSLRCLVDSTVTVSVDSTAVVDAVGNAGVGSVSTAFTVDSVGPTVVLSSAEANMAVAAGSVVHVTATFTEQVVMSAADVEVSSGTVTNVHADVNPTTVLFDVVGCDEGFFTITVLTTITDVAGNGLAHAPAPLHGRLDQTPPLVVGIDTPVSLTVDGSTAFDPLPITLAFSEPVMLGDGSVVATGGAVSGLVPVDTGSSIASARHHASVWSAEVSAMVPGPVSVRVVGATDQAGLPLASEAMASLHVVFNPDAPATFLVAEDSEAAAHGGRRLAVIASSTMQVIIRSSGPTLMDSGSLHVTSGSIVGVEPSPVPAGGATAYRFTISGLTEGVVTVTLVAARDAEDGAALDVSGVAAREFLVDLTPPTAVITSPLADEQGHVATSPVPLMVQFSEPVVMLASTAIVASSGLLAAPVASDAQPDGSATRYVLQASAVSDGELVVTVVADGVADAAGHGLAGDAAATFIVSTVVPSLVAMRVAGHASDAPLATRETAMSLVATFSTPVVLEASSVSVSSGVVGVPKPSVSGSVLDPLPLASEEWVFNVTEAVEGALEATVAATLPASAGGASVAPATRVVAHVDVTPPTVAMVVVTQSPTSASMKVTFSEPVSGVHASAVQVVGGALADFTAVSTRQYTFRVVVDVPASAEGLHPVPTSATASVTVPAGVGVDVVGWMTTAGASVDVTVPVDLTPPAVASASVVDGATERRPGEVVEVWITFSEAVALKDSAATVVVQGHGSQDVVATGKVMRIRYRCHADDTPGRLHVAFSVTDVAGNVASVTTLPTALPVFGCSPCHDGEATVAQCHDYADTTCRLAPPVLFPAFGAAPLTVWAATASETRPGGAFVVASTAPAADMRCGMAPQAGFTWVVSTGHFVLPVAQPLTALNAIACAASSTTPATPATPDASLPGTATPAGAMASAVVSGSVVVSPPGSDDGIATVRWTVVVTGLAASAFTPHTRHELLSALASDCGVPLHRVTAVASDPAVGVGDATRRLLVAPSGDAVQLAVAVALQPLASETAGQVGGSGSPPTSADVVAAATQVEGAITALQGGGVGAFTAALASRGASFLPGPSALDTDYGDAGEQGSGSGQGGSGGDIGGDIGAGAEQNDGGIAGHSGGGTGDGAKWFGVPSEFVLGAFAAVVIVALVAVVIAKLRRDPPPDLIRTKSLVEWGPDKRMMPVVHRGFSPRARPGFPRFGSDSDDSIDPARYDTRGLSPRSRPQERVAKQPAAGAAAGYARRPTVTSINSWLSSDSDATGSTQSTTTGSVQLSTAARVLRWMFGRRATKVTAIAPATAGVSGARSFDGSGSVTSLNSHAALIREAAAAEANVAASFGLEDTGESKAGGDSDGDADGTTVVPNPHAMPRFAERHHKSRRHGSKKKRKKKRKKHKRSRSSQQRRHAVSARDVNGIEVDATGRGSSHGRDGDDEDWLSSGDDWLSGSDDWLSGEDEADGDAVLIEDDALLLQSLDNETDDMDDADDGGVPSIALPTPTTPKASSEARAPATAMS